MQENIEDDRDSSPPQLIGRRFNWVSLVKLIISCVVIVFIYRAIDKSRGEFEKANFSISQIKWSWLVLASGTYVLGMVPMGLNWHRLLVAMQQQVPRWEAVRTHLVSQLGKYVPGKACVPAIRLSMLAKYKLHAPTALVSMLAETLSMMSVGAVVGACIVAVIYRSRPDIVLVAVGLALAAGAPVIPPVLRFALRFLAKRRAKKTGESLTDVTRDLTWPVVVPGWLGIVPGWMLLGVSMFATMKALNLPETNNMTLAQLPWVTASYAISAVGGFMSMLPGGVFVREWLMKELIEPSYGSLVAVLAPVLHRMMSLVSELVISAILYLTRTRSS